LNNGYENLYRCVSIEGIVVELGDTILNREQMENNGFKLLISSEIIGQRVWTVWDRIWQKVA